VNILGIGTEIVECARIGRMVERHGETFLRKVFTPREISECNARRQPLGHFAARWSTKEAILKALGITWRGPVAWTDLEIRQEAAEKPTVHVGGSGKEYLLQLRVTDILVSFAHSRLFASGYAVILSRPKTKIAPPIATDDDLPF
jgi:holo-[acyl-carrier protein] synthase